MTRDGERPFWEAVYRDPGAEAFGAPAEEVVRVAGRLPADARALDLGCGDGRNAMALAERGVRVDAVDRSEAGVRRLRARARDAGVEVAVWVQELETLTLRRHYELVVAHGVLHLLTPRARDRVLERTQEHTAPGGWNIVAVFTDRIPSPPDLAPHTHGLFAEGELKEHYDGWTVDEWRAYTLEDEHPGGIRHRHAVNKIVARKPGDPR